MTLEKERRGTGQPFRVALAGGSTPAMLYSLLASSFSTEIDWERVHLFFGDERCVPPTHEFSNYRMAEETLISHVPIPASNIFRMPGELPDVKVAAQEYADTLRNDFMLEEGELPSFDLILLGMGPDGHCASLFPHKPALRVADQLVVASKPGLKPEVMRLTLTIPVLNASNNVLFLVAGADKASTLKQVLEGEMKPELLPSQSIRPITGKLTWLVDEAAAASLTSP